MKELKENGFVWTEMKTSFLHVVERYELGRQNEIRQKTIERYKLKDDSGQRNESNMGEYPEYVDPDAERGSGGERVR